MIVDRVHYVAGVRDLEPTSLGDAGRFAEQAKGFVWVALSDPHADELGELGAAFDLPQVSVEPRRDRHERPRLEAHGQITILTLKTVRHAPGRPLEPGKVDILVGGR
jgi:magnesium transporter